MSTEPESHEQDENQVELSMTEQPEEQVEPSTEEQTDPSTETQDQTDQWLSQIREQGVRLTNLQMTYSQSASEFLDKAAHRIRDLVDKEFTSANHGVLGNQNKMWELLQKYEDEIAEMIDKFQDLRSDNKRLKQRIDYVTRVAKEYEIQVKDINTQIQGRHAAEIQDYRSRIEAASAKLEEIKEHLEKKYAAEHEEMERQLSVADSAVLRTTERNVELEKRIIALKSRGLLKRLFNRG